jgi:hypothetical protein
MHAKGRVVWRTAVATIGAFLAGCNAIWGLEERPLLADASTPVMEASASEGGTSCTAALPDPSDAAGSCPPLEAGACGPQNFTPPPFKWVGPTRANNQCSGDQLKAAIAACLAPQSTSASCSAWKTQSMANETCFNCLFSDLGAATYGAFYVYPGEYATFNNAGCVALLDPCWDTCAEIFQKYVDCDYNACAPSCTTGDQFNTCGTQANACACVTQSQDTFACQNAIMAAASPAAICLTTDQDTIDNLLGLFCGAPDAG